MLGHAFQIILPSISTSTPLGFLMLAEAILDYDNVLFTITVDDETMFAAIQEERSTRVHLKVVSQPAHFHCYM